MFPLMAEVALLPVIERVRWTGWRAGPVHPREVRRESPARPRPWALRRHLIEPWAARRAVEG